MSNKLCSAAAGLLVASSIYGFSAGSASAACFGVCGVLGADGHVTASPLGGTYDYVTTAGGTTGVGSLGLGTETNGSLLTTQFSANAGDVLKFYFNYVTSDGAGFADYAWAQLQTPGGTPVATLFTARTTPGGDTVPGFGMPAPAATMTPASTPIIEVVSGVVGPTWSPLGGSSGACWDVGCGYTGWIESTYVIGVAGLYQLAFGVTNWDDTLFDSGMAIDGLKLNNVELPIGDVPLPAALPLFASILAGGGFIAWRRKRKLADGSLAAA